MTPLALKQRLSSASPTFGVFSSIASCVAFEQLALAGYDYVIIDVEHTLFNPAQLDSLLLAAKASGISALVRIPNSRWDWIAPLLDAGATGIIAANIKTAAEAEALVAASYYYPLGKRGLNSTRFNGYASQDLAASNTAANTKIVLIAMIESREGLANASAITAVTGIDAILEGAADLSQDLGLPWQTQHPDVKSALQDLQTVCARQSCGYIALPRQLPDISQWRMRGIHHFVLGDDRSIMRRAHQQHLNAYLQEYQLGG
ncbi:HpcH/HpaI aldolase [Shewanella denitrificans OS217]|jgi:staphyloferrin B biosynthesis citrate synthase|uniref:HpcH/HpaI aldolase n=1 Tax=Shewanella denitrificans (strain OS217 / ATCC BAA-1090 / DSM 15013) TaxID=318161 RepID=Q12RQ1_SHEDO|nr:aldolase/citrate lyase family protein [Shewanella denitrificans]ABE53875.1 HpcH/HpaI aldolase [Shewanella denitrificans OS217]